MKFIPAVLFAAATLTQVNIARAESLKGSQVSGTLFVDGDTGQSLFDQSSAKVNGLIEFTGQSFNGTAGYCEYTANFSAAKVAIKDLCSQASTLSTAAILQAAKRSHDAFEMVFTDPAFFGDALSPIKNGLGLSDSLSGDTLTFDLTDGMATSNKSTFAFTTAVTPEPASWQLLFLGCGSMLGLAYMTRMKVS